MDRKSSKALTIYLLLNFFQFAFFWMAFTVDSLYFVIQAALDPLQLVLVGTTLEASILIFEIPTGIVADLYSRRLSTIIGIFLIGFGFIVQGSWALFMPILIAQVLWGVGYTFTSGAVEAWISDEIGEENAPNAFVRGAQFGQIGSIFGIIIGAGLGTILLRLPIILGGALFLFLGVFLIFSMPEDGFVPIPSQRRNTLKNMLSTFRSGMDMIRMRPALARILLIGFFYGLYSEGFDRLWVAHLLERFSFPDIPETIWFGIIMGVGFLLSAGALEIIKRRLDLAQSQRLIRALMFSSLGLIICLVLFGLAGHFSLAIGIYWVISILRSINSPFFTAWINQGLDSRVRATIISMAGQMDAIGQVAGGPGVGVIAREMSMPAGLFSSAALLSPVIPILARQLGKKQD
jgi:DHA3 family tetracycline resistance protein-like MFS transporter